MASNYVQDLNSFFESARPMVEKMGKLKKVADKLSIQDEISNAYTVGLGQYTQAEKKEALLSLGTVDEILQKGKDLGLNPNFVQNLIRETTTKSINTADINIEEDKVDLAPVFVNDDVTGKVLEARQNGDLSRGERIRRQVLSEQRAKIADMPYGVETPEFDPNQLADPKPFLKDVGGGMIESVTQAGAGALDAVSEIVNLIDIDPMVAGAFAMAAGGGELGAKTAAKAAKTVSEIETPTIEAKPRTVTGSLIRGVSQFLTGFGPALKVVKGTGKAAPYIAGVIADSAVFNPMEARLSNLVQEVPELSNPVTEYLAASPGDTEAEGRFKNGLEGLLLGGIADAFFSTVKFIKSGKEVRRVAEETGQPVEKIIDEAAGTDVGIARQADQAPEDEFIPFEKLAEESSVTIEVPEFKTGTKKAKPEQAQNINLSKLNTTEDVQNLLDRVAQADSKGINKARREVITNEELPKLADDLGMTVDDLMNRRQGEAFNAEQILAARKILVASSENLVELAKKAADGGDTNLALFRRAMTQHRAIQQQVSGMTAEAGRALQSFNIIAESSRMQQRAIKDALDASGGTDVNQKMAQMLASFDNAKQVGEFVRKANDVTNVDMLYEVWINGLLSSPATHMVNILSNTMVVALTVGERRMARALGGNVPPGETTAMLKGMVDGARDGFRLGWKALKSGEPTDVLEKIEVDKRRAISGDNLNLSGLAGRFADFIGEVVRIPGRLLTAEDAFFKSVGYRMELNAQAYRQAFNEGLKDEAAAKRVLAIVNNPPDNIKLAAIDASRYQTFTNSLDNTKFKFVGGIGKLAEKARSPEVTGSAAPYLRVLLPFVRTPTNIASFTLERTPVAFLSKNIRAEIAAGGARRDVALAKIATGSMMMAVSADLALSGTITGAGPVDRDMKNIKRAAGWQPYSIKIGDKYYAYNRLDPIGGLIGLSADMTEILGQTSEADTLALTSAAILSATQNMASKTYLSNFMGTMDAIFTASTDPMASNKQIQYLLGRMGASIIPAGVAAIERTVSPELSAAYSFLDQVKSRIPGFSTDLPPRRNIFGEPVVLGGGLGPDIMSPIYTSEIKDNPVADEIIAQEVSISMPKKVINGVELDAQQYDRYIVLYSGKDNPGVRNVPLKTKLKEMFSTSAYKRATDGPEGGKQLVISSIFQGYQQAAKKQLVKEYPEIEADIKAVKAEKIFKRTGFIGR